MGGKRPRPGQHVYIHPTGRIRVFSRKGAKPIVMSENENGRVGRKSGSGKKNISRKGAKALSYDGE